MYVRHGGGGVTMVEVFRGEVWRAAASGFSRVLLLRYHGAMKNPSTSFMMFVGGPFVVAYLYINSFLFTRR